MSNLSQKEYYESFLNYLDKYEKNILETPYLHPLSLANMLKNLQVWRKDLKGNNIEFANDELKAFLIEEHKQYAKFIKKLALKRGFSNAVFGSFIINLVNNYKQISVIDYYKEAYTATIICLKDLINDLKKQNFDMRNYRIRTVYGIIKNLENNITENEVTHE
ncbi:MAG: hypothetical protein E7376_04940 [Clostridiales bacterium]|nr:hypothetical protein [Clostridiales bacterium]